METAKHWVYTIPQAFSNLLKCFHLEYKTCSPEYVSYFDSFTGNGRNHDLLITAQDKNDSRIIISVESKVDEKFGITIDEYLAEISKKKAKGENTNADKRIDLLQKALFANPNDTQISKLRYQLLTAIAGTLSEAKKQDASKAIFVVQTFLSHEMDSKRHRQNQRDLDYFLEVFTHGTQKIIHDGDLLGPFTVPGNEFIPGVVELWIGKYSVKI